MIPQGESTSTTLRDTGPIVHLALWSQLVNRTRCGREFWTIPDWVDGAAKVEADIDCMACIVLADTYEIPLKGDRPGANYLDEKVWFKQVIGPPYGHVTDCCHAENPCPYHEQRQ